MHQEQVFFAVTLDNGRTDLMGFYTVQRGPSLPSDAVWIDPKEHPGWWRREPTHAAVFGEIVRAHLTGPQPIGYRRIEPSEVFEKTTTPEQRLYRNAVVVDEDGVLQHDMGKARAIHLRGVRDMRQPGLDQLDRDWMRATGQGKKQEADDIEAERQKLRDLPATLGVENVTTVDELKALGLGLGE